MGLIADPNAAAIGRRFGESGVAFVRELPGRLAEVVARWRLVVVDPLPVGIGGYLVGVRTADGVDAVLKLSPAGVVQDAGNRLEAYALARWQGKGAVRLLRADPGVGALLLERCVPGAAVDSLADGEMVRIGCRLARRLHREPDATDRESLAVASSELADQAAQFAEAFGRLGHPLSRRAESIVARLHEELAAGGGELVVCHGDLNPGNVLSSRREGWLACDPLPLLADTAYDAASLVWSKRPWLLAQPDPAAVLGNRIGVAAEAIGATEHRVWAWTLVRVSALLVERSSWGGYDEAPFVEVAELLCAHPPEHARSRSSTLQ